MPKDRPPASATVKIDAALLLKAKQIAALDGCKLTDYFDRVLRGPIERDHSRSMKRIVEEQGRNNSE
jgi:hypothetical protein